MAFQGARSSRHHSTNVRRARHRTAAPCPLPGSSVCRDWPGQAKKQQQPVWSPVQFRCHLCNHDFAQN